jgi:pimeloyl-ACP methyl ester carboxylesterase
MLHVPAPKGKKRDILLLYGHHSSLERWWGIVQVLNRYGAVTMPDFPGFGGMDSLYKLGRKPTLDEMADYLAAFVRMRYKRKRVTIVGMSFGFVVATRMLQRFPDLTKKVDMLISLVGFAHKDDFIFKPARYWSYRIGATIFARPLPAKFFHAVCLRPIILRTFYTHTHNAKHKFTGLTPEIAKRMTEIEIWLWRNNDIRTYMTTTVGILTLNNCDRQVDLPVWHIGMKADHFFENHLVEQHLQVIFNDFHGMTVNLPRHAPTVVADEKAAAPFVPARLRRELSRQ